MKHWSEMDGLTSFEACEILVDLAAEVPAHQHIVEVGVYKGKSLAALCVGALEGNGAQVTGIDPWNLPRPSKPKYSSDDTYTTAMNNLKDYPVTLVRGFSIEVAGLWSTSEKIGLWYLDADHRELPVLQDFAAWAPHFIPGETMVAFDDCHPDFPGVIKAVQKLNDMGRIGVPVKYTDRLAVARFVQ